MASQEQKRFESSITNSKGKQLYTRYWYKDDWRKSSDKEPKALLLLLHGLCEHCLWYNEMAEFLNAQGIYVYAHDHVGHGQSEGSRVYVEKFQEYVDDSILHAEKMKKEYPDVPMFVHGHSMGGLITILLMNQRPDLFKGAILNGPLITLDNLPPGFVVWLGRMVSTIFPHFPARKLDSKGVSRDTALEHYQCQTGWMQIRTDILWVMIWVQTVCKGYQKSTKVATSKERVNKVKRYEEDPLVHRGALKCGQVATMMDAMATVVSSLADIDWPFLILHSEIDELTSVEGSKLMYEKAKSKDKYLKLFSEGFHMLHGELEPVKSETLNLIASWITERSTNQTS